MNLAAEMARLPEPPNNSKPPLWDAWRHELWRLAQQDDPKNFVNWPPIYHTMLVEHWSELMRVEFDYVAGRIDMDQVLSDIPFDFGYHPTRTPEGRNLIHQAYHILRWQEATGLRIADMQSIYEFGGGYGAMALVCNRLGFRGRYYIYDLPEFALLQRWYLEECGVGNVQWVGQSHIVDPDLFIACYSLSETDFDERYQILQAAMAESYIFLYSNKFEQYDNIEFFQRSDMNEWWPNNWRHERIEHLPPESWYTWGW